MYDNQYSRHGGNTQRFLLLSDWVHATRAMGLEVASLIKIIQRDGLCIIHWPMEGNTGREYVSLIIGRGNILIIMRLTLFID